MCSRSVSTSRRISRSLFPNTPTGQRLSNGRRKSSVNRQSPVGWPNRTLWRMVLYVYRPPLALLKRARDGETVRTPIRRQQSRRYCRRNGKIEIEQANPAARLSVPGNWPEHNVDPLFFQYRFTGRERPKGRCSCGHRLPRNKRNYNHDYVP